MKNHLDTLYPIKRMSKSFQAECRDSELVRYNDRRAETDTEEINGIIMDAWRHHYGSVVQPSKLGCATLFSQSCRDHSYLSSKFFCEGSESLSAKAQESLFLTKQWKHKCSFFGRGFAQFFDRETIFKDAFQHVFRKILKLFLLFFVSSLAFACSDTTTAERGTGSDGESFIYGVTVDSLANETLFASEIILARVEWVDSEYQETLLDTVYSDIDGNFSLSPADTGEYMLRFNWNDSLYAQIRNLSFDGDSLALGKVGLYRSIQVSGGLPLPECANAEVQVVGFPETVLADSTGTFVLDSVHAGRGELVAYCEGSTYSWTLVLSGACENASLGALEIISSTSKQNSASGTVGGSQNLQKQSQPIVVDAHCNVK